MRVLVLGINGMLGRYVYTYLNNKFEVVGTTRRELDAKTINKDILVANINSGDVVINCIGLIKQRINVSVLDFIQVNSVFPLLLAEVCEEIGCHLIHVTTDCVFNGRLGFYDEKQPHDATDIYGKTKSLGEPSNATVIRTSIIGEETNNFLSLVEWVKSNKGKQVNGYINHFWNGITCLQFAKVCEHMIKNNIFWQGVKHIYSPVSISKQKLIDMISDEYSLNIKTIPFKTPKCDRTLVSIREDVNIEIPDLKIQIREMKEFYE